MDNVANQLLGILYCKIISNFFMHVFWSKCIMCIYFLCGSFSMRSVSDHLLQKYFYIIINIVLYVYHNHTHPVLKKKTLNHQLVSWQKINKQLFWLIMFIWVTLLLPFSFWSFDLTVNWMCGGFWTVTWTKLVIWNENVKSNIESFQSRRADFPWWSCDGQFL